jgi:flagellar basal-body rod modification protein FlgD
MAQSMDLQRASSLVGQEVYIKTTDSSGNTNYVQGKVDYVVYENSKAYLSINESLYSIDDLDTVVDSEYLSAYNKATDFATAMNKLPNVKILDLTSASKVDELESTYNGMTDYEKTFVASDYVTSLEKYVEKIKELRLAEEEAAKNAEETENTDTDEDIDEGDDSL